MRVPFWPDPFATVKAELPFRLASDFARFTSWVDPNESAAGRFSPDMVNDIECRVQVEVMRWGVNDIECRVQVAVVPWGV